MDDELKNLLCCTLCGGDITYLNQEKIKCLICHKEYLVQDGIPLMFPDVQKEENDDIFQRYLTCYEKIAKDDIKEPLEKNKNQRYIPLKDFIGEVTNCRILDVGAGQGTFLRMLEGKYKVCFDISLNYLKVAKESKLVAVAGNAEFLPFKPQSFDIIICSDILEHVLHPDKVITHLKRVLSPEGRLYIVVPWKEDLSKYKRYNGIYEFTHLRTFDNISINKLLVGFKICRRKGVIPNSPPSFWPYIIQKAFRFVPSKIQMVMLGPIHMMFEVNINQGKIKKETNKICMLAGNDIINDPRVKREASVVTTNGYEVTIVGTLTPRSQAIEDIDGFRIIRVSQSILMRVLRAIHKSVRIFFARLSGKGRQENNSADTNSLTPYSFLSRLLVDFYMILFLIDTIWQMSKQAKKIKADIYHANDLDTLPAAYFAARANRAKLVYDAHELWYEMNPDRTKLFKLIASIVERYFIKKVDCCITVNESIVEIMAENYKIKKPVVIGNYPHYEKIINDSSHLRDSLNINHQTKIILYQGRYELHRGLEELIESAKYLENGLIVFRGYGMNEADLKMLVERLNLENKVIFVPPVLMSDLVQKATEADIGVMPYKPVSLNNRLATPNKVYEYLMANLAIAVSDLPEMRRIVEEFKVGVLFDPTSPEDIARAINELTTNESRLTQARMNAKKASQERYNWEKEGGKLLQIYNSLMKGIGDESE